MVTLHVKLKDLDDQVLLPRLSQTWELFWHGVLPYVEGVSGVLSFALILIRVS